MTVVYADSVFLLNGVMDYVLFLVTARLAGIPLKRRRYLLAALLGAVYAVAVFFPSLHFLSAAVAGGLWGRGKTAAARFTAVCRGLCHGGLRIGPWIAGR